MDITGANAQHCVEVIKSFIIVITCHEISVMELTNGIGLKPRYFVTEISIEHVEAWLR